VTNNTIDINVVTIDRVDNYDACMTSVGAAHARGAGGGPRRLAANLGVGEIFREVYLATPMC